MKHWDSYAPVAVALDHAAAAAPVAVPDDRRPVAAIAGQEHSGAVRAGRTGMGAVRRGGDNGTGAGTGTGADADGMRQTRSHT